MKIGGFFVYNTFAKNDLKKVGLFG